MRQMFEEVLRALMETYQLGMYPMLPKYVMFRNAVNFDQDLTNWDVSNVTNMKQMFYACTNFNGDISSWDVSDATDMSNMFDVAQNFNTDISSWDVSSVSNMKGMFLECQALIKISGTGMFQCYRYV